MESKDKTVSFKLNRVTIEQFAIMEDSFQQESPINLETNLRFSANEQSRLIGIFALSRFSCEQKPFIIIEVGCHFEFKPESWEVMINKNNLLVPKGIMQHLGALTIGTTRGVLFAKTENTTFNQYVLPLINVTEMIMSDIPFEFNQ